MKQSFAQGLTMEMNASYQRTPPGPPIPRKPPCYAVNLLRGGYAIAVCQLGIPEAMSRNRMALSTNGQMNLHPRKPPGRWRRLPIITVGYTESIAFIAWMEVRPRAASMSTANTTS